MDVTSEDLRKPEEALCLRYKTMDKVNAWLMSANLDANSE